MSDQPEENKLADALSNSTVLYIGVAVLVVAILATLGVCSLRFANENRGSHRAAMSMTNMNGIGKALMLYASANDDKLPPTMETLVTDGYSSERMFTHPTTNYRLEIIDGKFDSDPDYVYFLDFPVTDNTNKIRGYEKIRFAKDGKVAVLLNDGAVTRMAVTELNKQLKADGHGPVE